MSGRRGCNLDGQPISAHDQAYIDAFAAENTRLAAPPWWWQMTGRTLEQWTALDHHQQLAAHRPHAGYAPRTTSGRTLDA